MALLAGGVGTLLGICGPFTDVSDPVFCPFVQEIYYLGITTGTSPTTYSPDEPVTRLQAAAFLSRTVDLALERGTRRAALGEFWTPRGDLPRSFLGEFPQGARERVRLTADPTDDIYLAAAAEGLAEYLVSGDRHLLDRDCAAAPWGSGAAARA